MPDPSSSEAPVTLEGIRVVGRPCSFDLVSLEEADRLLETAWALRPTTRLVPRGVYRFRTFEEAELWMTRTIARTLARHGSRTSHGSREPSTIPAPATS